VSAVTEDFLRLEQIAELSSSLNEFPPIPGQAINKMTVGRQTDQHYYEYEHIERKLHNPECRERSHGDSRPNQSGGRQRRSAGNPEIGA
jgi:hypothetical protein